MLEGGYSTRQPTASGESSAKKQESLGSSLRELAPEFGDDEVARLSALAAQANSRLHELGAALVVKGATPLCARNFLSQLLPQGYEIASHKPALPRSCMRSETQRHTDLGNASPMKSALKSSMKKGGRWSQLDEPSLPPLEQSPSPSPLPINPPPGSPDANAPRSALRKRTAPAELQHSSKTQSSMNEAAAKASSEVISEAKAGESSPGKSAMKTKSAMKAPAEKASENKEGEEQLSPGRGEKKKAIKGFTEDLKGDEGSEIPKTKEGEEPGSPADPYSQGPKQRFDGSVTLADVASLVTSKSKRSQLATQQTADSDDHPLLPLLTAGKIDVPQVQKALSNLTKEDENGVITTVMDLNACLSPGQNLPPPIFYAISLRSVVLAGLLIEHRVDVRKRYSGAKQYKGILNGMTPLDATNNLKLRFKGTSLGFRYQAIEELIKAEEERLRGRRRSRALVATTRMLGLRANTKQLSMQILDEVEHGEKEIDVEGEEKLEQKAEEEREQLEKQKSETHPEQSFKAQYEILSKIGEGTFGSVSVAQHFASNQHRAVKAISTSLIGESVAWQEIAILQQVEHENIAQLYESFDDGNYTYMVLEYCKGGGVFDAVLEAEDGVPESAIARIAKQMLSAVGYLHTTRIAHRDLKPENFLLLNKEEGIENAIVKLVDFETARTFVAEDTPEFRTKICTLHFVAPEILGGSSMKYSEKCDVWSLGVCFFLLLCGQPPFTAETDLEVLKKINMGKYTFEPADVWANVSEPAKDLIEKMLTADSKQRCAADKAFNHEWIQGSAPGNIAGRKVSGGMRSFLYRCQLRKVATRIMQQGISDITLQEIKASFLKADGAQSGKLPSQLIEDIIVSSTAGHEAKLELRQTLHSMVDGGNLVDYDQLLRIQFDRRQYTKQEACKVAFDMFDLNKNGAITKEELQEVLGGMVDGAFTFEEEHVTMQDVIGVQTDVIDNLVKDCDKNRDGQIDFQEFMNMMCSGDGPLAAQRIVRRASGEDRFQTTTELIGELHRSSSIEKEKSNGSTCEG